MMKKTSTTGYNTQSFGGGGGTVDPPTLPPNNPPPYEPPVEVPEPATFLIFGLGSVMLMKYRNKGQGNNS